MDGSKDEPGVAAAACSPTIYFASSHPAEASIKLFDIMFAHPLIKKACVDTTTFFSDSLSVLRAIANCQTNHPLILNICLEYNHM